MLWLKRFDVLCQAFPKAVCRRHRAASSDLPIVLRPGGLGDMVLLTRAAAAAGADLTQIIWFGERRNLAWIEYLGLTGLAYDNPGTFLRGLGGSPCSALVINSEQTFGLSALFAGRLAAAGGTLIGFDSNARADLYDRKVSYCQERHELDSFRDLFEAAALSGSKRGELWPLPERLDGQYDGVTAVAFAGLENPVKALSAEAWRSIAENAKKEHSTVVAIGTPADRVFSERVLDGVGMENLVGQLSFPQVVDLLRGAKRLISVDSGLIHVADYCGVPTDVIFPGGNPKKWRPLHPESTVIESLGDLPSR